jgi:tocopherol cyclase
MDYRNGYMLQNGLLTRRGYDWWWHSLVGVSRQTDERQPFFIEYFVINPALGGAKPVYGQLSENQRQGIKPSYALLKAGTWKPGKAVQIHNFYGIDDFSARSEPLLVKIGPYILTETNLNGSVSLSSEDAAAHPEYMSETGELSWDLKADKRLSYSVGFGASSLSRALMLLKCSGMCRAC